MRKRLAIVAAVLCLAAPAFPRAQAAKAPPAAEAAALTAQDAATLLAILGQAGRQGFSADDFRLDDLAAQLDSNEPTARRRAEARLKIMAIAYARAQHGGRLPHDRFPNEWAIRPEAYDAEADFAAAVAGHRLAAWAASLPPPDARYGRLVQALAHYQGIAADGGWRPVSFRQAMKPGATGADVQALRQRLAVEDPSATMSAAPGAARADVYDPKLAAAVARAQARYGLAPDGVAGARTVAALNVPVQQRLGQIRANLERWRWAPRHLPAYRLELNIADASLELYDDGKPALNMRAIVGRPAKRTPMFRDQIKAVVFNPPWNVPADIAAKEIWPKIRRDPGYMAREHFIVRPGGGLQQLPGPDCALGTIKFDLSNNFGVYLHDTPAKSLFARESRTLSHGCMRLEKANELAKRVLKGDPNWSDTKIDLALVSGKTVRAPVRRSAPVYVLYWTVFVNDAGEVQFRPDVYGWDKKLLAGL